MFFFFLNVSIEINLNKRKKCEVMQGLFKTSNKLVVCPPERSINPFGFSE